jgi:hypothetical protein
MQIVIAMSDQRRPGVNQNVIGQMMSSHSWLTKRVCDDWEPPKCRTFQVPFHLIKVSKTKGVSPTVENVNKYLAGEALTDETLSVWKPTFFGACQASTLFVDTTPLLHGLSQAKSVSQLINALYPSDVAQAAARVYDTVKVQQHNVHNWTITDEHLNNVVVPESIGGDEVMSFHFRHVVGAMLAEWSATRGSRCQCTYDIFK